jgi:hypothetical protein
MSRGRFNEPNIDVVATAQAGMPGKQGRRDVIRAVNIKPE